MSINAVYGEYFQKSRIFLYPLLKIERGASATPIQTYISWNDKIDPSEMKLVCLYHLRNDPEYRSFEQRVLLRHELFDDFKELEDNKAIYIFNLSKYSTDYTHFLEGHYSKFSATAKKLVADWFGKDTANHMYAESYLYPGKYFALYARLLNAADDVEKGEKILREVGELCDKPNFQEETLNMKEKDILIDLKEK